jgi:ketosteroid isomerase-like protein
MSQENVEAIRAVYARFSEGAFRASVDLLDRHVLYLMMPDAPEAECRGRSGRDGDAALLETWADLTVDAEELIAAGNTVLVSVRQRGVARISGVPTEGHYFNALVLSRSQGDPDRELSERAQALEAAGLRE